MKVLVVAEHLKGEVQEVTRELITAAEQIGDTVIVALIANDPTPLIDQINIGGVKEILTIKIESPEFESDVYLQAVDAIYREVRPNAILMGFTVNSIGYGSALAAKLNLGCANDVFAMRLESDVIVVERAFYGGKVNGELDFPDKDSVVLLLRRGTWQLAEGAGNASVRELTVEIESIRTRHVGFKEIQADDEIDISKAEFLLCIGRGIGEKENLDRFELLAEQMGATLAVSRPLIDAGWVSRARLVGQSGKTVKPKVCLSFGISGAVQHLAGMKDSGMIIAINTDSEASIFNVAHYGAVMDLFEVADELEKCF